VKHIIFDEEEEAVVTMAKKKVEKNPIAKAWSLVRKALGKGRPEDEESLSYDPEFKVYEFAMASLAPIHVQRGINKRVGSVKKARDYWVPIEEIVEKDMVAAVNEMFAHADHILDVTTFNSLLRLIAVSLLFVSACAGWGFGGATAIWKLGMSEGLDSLDYYIRCNGNDGVYPAFGTYP
jgi:hypothetical protein